MRKLAYRSLGFIFLFAGTVFGDSPWPICAQAINDIGSSNLNGFISPIRKKPFPIDKVLRFQDSSVDEIIATLRKEDKNLLVADLQGTQEKVDEKSSVIADLTIDMGPYPVRGTPEDSEKFSNELMYAIENYEFGATGIMQFKGIFREHHTRLFNPKTAQFFPRGFPEYDIIILVRIRNRSTEEKIKATLIHEYIHFLNSRLYPEDFELVERNGEQISKQDERYLELLDLDKDIKLETAALNSSVDRATFIGHLNNYLIDFLEVLKINMDIGIESLEEEMDTYSLQYSVAKAFGWDDQNLGLQARWIKSVHQHAQRALERWQSFVPGPGFQQNVSIISASEQGIDPEIPELLTTIKNQRSRLLQLFQDLPAKEGAPDYAAAVKPLEIELKKTAD